MMPGTLLADWPPLVLQPLQQAETPLSTQRSCLHLGLPPQCRRHSPGVGLGWPPALGLDYYELLFVLRVSYPFNLWRQFFQMGLPFVDSHLPFTKKPKIPSSPL